MTVSLFEEESSLCYRDCLNELPEDNRMRSARSMPKVVLQPDFAYAEQSKMQVCYSLTHLIEALRDPAMDVVRGLAALPCTQPVPLEFFGEDPPAEL